MLKPRLLAVLTLFSGLSAAFAQEEQNSNWRLYQPSVARDSAVAAKTGVKYARPSVPGRIVYVQSKKIETLDSLKKVRPTLMDGYRVQLFFGSREEAQQKRADFLRQFPDTRAHISYLAPNFRLRVGDFRTRIESEAFKRSLDAYFSGSYIVRDKIELPLLPDTHE